MLLITCFFQLTHQLYFQISGYFSFNVIFSTYRTVEQYCYFSKSCRAIIDISLTLLAVNLEIFQLVFLSAFYQIKCLIFFMKIRVSCFWFINKYWGVTIPFRSPVLIFCVCFPVDGFSSLFYVYVHLRLEYIFMLSFLFNYNYSNY